MTEQKIRQITGVILWSISAILGMGLYLGYAGTSWISVGLAFLLSASLEVGKVLSWRRGSWYRLISVCLSVMTFLAVLGTTMIRIESTKSSSLQARLGALQNSRVYMDLLGQRKEAEKQLEALLTRIEGTPSDWATVSLKLNAEADDLRKEQSELSSKLTALEQQTTAGSTSAEPSIFRALGSVIGQEEEKVELVVLLALAVMVEVTAFSLAGHSGKRKASGVNAPKKALESQEPQPKPNTKPNPEPNAVRATQFNGGPNAEDYLKVALDHPRKPYLLGRGPVSERLGISEAQAKDLVEELVRDGKVRRESKYFVAV